jgi:hypothetical protein
VARLRLPWRRPAPPDLDHGHVPYAAWEAELTAYARLRSGAELKVSFELSHHNRWGDALHLPRPLPGSSPDQAFAAAEVELEHALMHYRHGWREAALLWQTWLHPDEEIHLPWPPWDQVALPARVVRGVLGRAVPALQLPSSRSLSPERLRSAVRWLAAAWEDGLHRDLELAERPGLAARLPPPALPARPSPWLLALVALARRDGDLATSAPAPVAAAVIRLLAAGPDDLDEHVAAVLSLGEALAERRLLPPVPEQRPAWLRAPWGRWRAAPRLRKAFDDLARSPDTPASAAISAALRAAQRRRALAAGGGGAALGQASRATAPGGESAHGAGAAAGTEAGVEVEPPPEGWGVQPGQQLPQHVSAGPRAGQPPPAAEGAGEGQGTAGGAAGPGTLGALHVISPSAEDRAAYWQLRGALAPYIERLVERLEATGDAYYAATPHRFQRQGRLDRSRLAAAMAGREAVFSRFVKAPAPEHALCLLLDCSASMHDYAESLREMAIVVEAAASTVGARVTAFGFGASWERMEPAAKGAPLLALGRELRPHGGTPFGPALADAAAWLAQQPYERKRLWVFSDGRWSARDRNAAGWRPDQLRNVLVWVLGETAPEPPHPAMRVVAAPTLEKLVEAAPRFFWDAGPRGQLPGSRAVAP